MATKTRQTMPAHTSTAEHNDDFSIVRLWVLRILCCRRSNIDHLVNFESALLRLDGQFSVGGNRPLDQDATGHLESGHGVFDIASVWPSGRGEQAGLEAVFDGL